MTGVEVATLAVAVGSAAYGATQQSKAAEAQADASSEQIAAQRRAEAARKRQADLTHARERRKAIRNAIIARSQALSSITNRGIGQGSSVVGGVLGGIQSEVGQQSADIAQNQQITNEVFDANEASAVAGDRFNQARAQGAQGAAISNFGSTVARNFGPISRIGNSLTGNAGSPSNFGMTARTGLY